LEKQKSLAYKELWVNAENIYRQEQYRIDIERKWNKASWMVLTIGTLILLAL
jgi:hypothetical protein